jgi:hypothetical protein
MAYIDFEKEMYKMDLFWAFMDFRTQAGYGGSPSLSLGSNTSSEGGESSTSGNDGGGGTDNQEGGNTGDKINEANSLTSPYTAWFGFVGNAAKNELKLYNLPGFGLKSMSSIGSKIGFAGSSFSLLASANNIYITEGSWGSYMQLSFSLGMIGLNYVPVVGPYLAFGLSTYEAGGGFQCFYNGMNEYQKFYNRTGIIMLPPLNPSMVPIFLNFGAN